VRPGDRLSVGQRHLLAAPPPHVHADASGGTIGVDIGGIVATNNNVAVNVSVALGGVLTFDVHDNTATNDRSHGLNLFVSANATGNVSGFLRNNIVGTFGTAGSGSEIGFPSACRTRQIPARRSDVTIQISGNEVQESTNFNLINVNQGITGNGGTASPTYLTITNNTFGNSGARGPTFQQNNNTTGSAAVSWMATCSASCDRREASYLGPWSNCGTASAGIHF
jgi:hypothetical protein